MAPRQRVFFGLHIKWTETHRAVFKQSQKFSGVLRANHVEGNKQLAIRRFHA